MPKKQVKDDAPPRWRDINQTIEEVPFSRMAIYRMIDAGLINSRVVSMTGNRGTGKRLIEVTSLLRYIEKSPTRSKSSITRSKAKAGRRSAHVRWNNGRKRGRK